MTLARCLVWIQSIVYDMVVGLFFCLFVLFCFSSFSMIFQLEFTIFFYCVVLLKKTKKVLTDPANKASMLAPPAGPSRGEGGAKGPAGQGGRGVQPR